MGLFFILTLSYFFVKFRIEQRKEGVMKFSIKDYVVLYPKNNGRWKYKAFQNKEKAYKFLEKNCKAVLIRWQVGNEKRKKIVRFPPRDTHYEAEQELFRLENDSGSWGIYVAEPDKHLSQNSLGKSCSPWLMYYSLEFHDQINYVKRPGGHWVPEGSEEDIKQKTDDYFK